MGGPVELLEKKGENFGNKSAILNFCNSINKSNLEKITFLAEKLVLISIMNFTAILNFFARQRFLKYFF
jgi:hypothetical protein